MRDVKLYLSALVMAGLASLPLTAQQPSQNPSPSTPQTTPSEPSPASPQAAPAQPTPQPGTPATQSGTQTADQVPSTANSPEVMNAQLRPVEGELEKKLDAKSAKVGDAVVVKTTEKATIADGVVIPKGSKIVGKVVEAQPVDGGNKNSKVTVLFNEAQLKDGQSLPIKSVLQSLSPAAGADNNAASYGSTAPMASSAPPSSGGAATGAPGGGSPMGSSAATQSHSDPGATAGTAPAMSAGNDASAGNAAPAQGRVVAQQGNVAIRTTQIPGVLIASSVNGQPFSNASGAILGAAQNVHLDGGTHVVLAVAEAGGKGTNTK